MVSAPEAVKDPTLRNGGICRGVHHYQIIAPRQDSEPPLPMVWLSVGFRLGPSRCQPSGPPRWPSLFVRSILLLPAPSLGPPIPERLCNAETCLIRDFQITQTATVQNRQSSGISAERSCVGARKVTQVPVHKLATDLGFRHVDQVLDFAISHAGSSRETRSRIILTPCIA